MARPPPQSLELSAAQAAQKTTLAMALVMVMLSAAQAAQKKRHTPIRPFLALSAAQAA